MAERETREQAEERLLELQADRMKRLEANPKYQELPFHLQDRVVQMLTPHLFNPQYEIAQLLSSIQTSKKLIKYFNEMALRNPQYSEECAEVIEMEKECISKDVTEIKRIQKGDFKWLVN